MCRKRSAAQPASRADQRAFEDLFSRVRPRIKRLLACKFGWSSRLDEVEETIQQALLRAWEHRDEFDAARGSRGAWFFRICIRVAYDRVSRTKREEQAFEPVPFEKLAEIALAASGCSEADEATEDVAGDPGSPGSYFRKRELVRGAIAELSERERNILITHAAVGPRLADEYLARELEMTRAAAKKARQRAIHKFKGVYESLRATWKDP